MIQEEIFLKLVRSAVKAPSGHNSQPWKFACEGDVITIEPDFSRALPVVDPDKHALYISLGCALENTLIAAAYYGYRCRTTINTSSDKTTIQIKLSQTEDRRHGELYTMIGKRQSSRGAFTEVPLSSISLETLRTAGTMEGVTVKLFTGRDMIRRLEPFIIEGSNRQNREKHFKKELISWMRFSEKEAMRSGDGLWMASMGLPNMGRMAGSFIMNRFVSAKSEARRWQKLLVQTAGLALFLAEQYNPEGWIRLGQAFQRFGLTAAKLDISHSHVNAPCEETTVRKKMMTELNLKEGTPCLVIRFGYSKPMPYSFRRPIENVIVNI